MRKIIQIAVDAEGYLYALCDDGTIWIQTSMRRNEFSWSKTPSVPQDSIPEQETTG